LTTYDKVYMPRPGRFLGMTLLLWCAVVLATGPLGQRRWTCVVSGALLQTLAFSL